MTINLSKTFFIQPQNVERKWLLVDAQHYVLGRLAAQVAKLLRGKHKVYYTPHINCGDNVVIINAAKIKLTGKKLQQKVYYHHTGYPGGIKQRAVKKILLGEKPESVLKLAIKRMLPKESSLSRKQFSSLHVYGSDQHPHLAQKPTLINLIKNR